jgi:AmmeMemoRadiSam system protein A
VDAPGPTALAALTLAREAVERYVHARVVSDPPADLPPGLRRPSGAFVTLRAGGRLRGCIGTLAPSQADLAREIVACAIAAATADPRFPPVRVEELATLTYEVDVVQPLEAAAGQADLDPRVYGVLVEGGDRRGVLLPDLEGVDTAAQQVAIARQKAGLAAEAPVRLYRFRAHRFREEEPAPPTL